MSFQPRYCLSVQLSLEIKMDIWWVTGSQFSHESFCKKLASLKYLVNR